jgi:1,4-alpha-glucan branching enzyme
MAATKTTTKKATAKKATAKKATAKKSTTRKTATSTTSKSPRLLERDPQVLLEDAGYAAAGVVHDAVERARALPSRIEAWRGEVEKAAKDAPERVKDLRTEVPTRVETTVKDVRVRISKDLQHWLDSFEKRFDSKAADGRKVAEDVRRDDRVKRVLDQTGNTRSQVKGALTSVVRTGSAAAEAGKAQADTATSQLKGAVTSFGKTADKAAEAGRKQAGTAATQVKAAATSTRKSAETIADAATD